MNGDGMSTTFDGTVSPSLSVFDRRIAPSAGTLASGAAISDEQLIAAPARRSIMRTPAWFPDVVDEMDDLIRRPTDWDSYGARRVSPRLALSLLKTLLKLTSENSRQPTVFGTSEGGAGLEWETPQLFVRLTLEPGGAPEIYYLDQISGTDWEAQIGEEPIPITAVLDRLSYTA